MDKNILIICSEPFSKTWAYYSIEVLEALRKSGYTIFFLYQKDMDSEEYERCIDPLIKKIPFCITKNKFLRFLQKIFSVKILLLIRGLCKEHDVRCVHSLSPGYILTNILPFLPRKLNFLYTVHDVIPHPNNTTTLFLRYMRFSEKRNVNIVQNLSTNSIHQYDYLRSLYPEKNISYFRMPSHISELMQSGDEICPELGREEKPYILFFGGIYLYKGIDILINAFQAASIKNTKLVIAGNGKYNPLEGVDDKNIIFIHRHIRDAEIRKLFLCARCVVYPYTSITQTAVVQFPYYFETPVIASDLEYFKDCIVDGETGLLFENGNVQQLASLLEHVCSDAFDMEKMKGRMREQFDRCYSAKGLGEELVKIYDVFE